MYCPVCNKLLKTIKQEAESLQFCLACGGVWIENDALYKLIKSLISDNKTNQQIVQGDKSTPFTAKRRKQLLHKCPRCNIDMNLSNLSYDTGLFVDKCPFCNGTWVDKNALSNIVEYLRGNTEAQPYRQALAEAQKQFSKGQKAKRKIIVLTIAALYIFAAFVFGRSGDWLRVLIFLIFPFGCIFFAKRIGVYWVAFLGWLLLFLPLFLAFWKVIFG